MAKIPLALAMVAGVAYTQAANDLISVNVTVAKNSGIVSDLTQAAFTILENGEPQVIKVFERDSRPASIGLIVDDSGTMREFGSGIAQLVHAFVRNLDPRDEVFLGLFNKDLFLSQDFTGDTSSIVRGLHQGKQYGPSALVDACIVATRHLQEHARNDKRVLIIISDGIDNSSNNKRDTLVRVLNDAGIIVYVLGVRSMDTQTSFVLRGKELLTKIAQPTGGMAFLSENLADLEQNAVQIAREIQSQYVIGYSPSHTARDGKLRKIEIKVNGVTGKGIQLRARSGYYAPGP